MMVQPIRSGNSSAPPPLHVQEQQKPSWPSSQKHPRTRSVSASGNGRSLPLRQASTGIPSASMMPLSHTPPRPSTHAFGGFGNSPAGVLSSPSLSNNDGFFGRESRADSIGTLWSSADVPLILDGHRGSGSEAGGSMMPSNSSRAHSHHGRPSSRGLSVASGAASSVGHPVSVSAKSSTAPPSDWDTSELLMSDDGQPFTPVRIGNRPPFKATVSGGWTVTDAKTVSSEKVLQVARLQQPGSRPGSSSGTDATTAATPPSLKKRPTRLHLASSSFDGTDGRAASNEEPRLMRAIDVPESVSQASRLTTSTIVPTASDSIQSVLFNAATPTRSTLQHPHARHSPKTGTPNGVPSNELYRYAERFFDSSYSMASPSVTTLAPVKSHSPDILRSSRFSDDSHVTALTMDDTTSSSNEHAPAYAYSQTSNSSGGSSSPAHDLLRECLTPQFPTTGGARLQPRIVTTERVVQDDLRQPFPPLAMTMTLVKPPPSPRDLTPTPSAFNTPMLGPRRPSTTDAAVPLTKTSAAIPNSQPSRARHAHTSSDHDALRRLKAEAGGGTKVEDRLAFLHAPAPDAVLPPSPKRGALFGLRIRAVSTPRLRQASRGAVASQDGAATTTTMPSGVSVANAAIAAYERESRPSSSFRAQHPPRAPSGRFRAPATADVDSELERSHSNTSSVSLHEAGTQSSTSFVGRFRRPSSSEALAAAARRFRRPSRNGSSSSQTGGERQRVGSNASSHVQQSGNSLHHTASNASLQSNIAAAAPRRSKVGTPTSATRPKTKGGWATHLAHGLTLHIEQPNGRKTAFRMNYQYYDPFGRPESLCRDLGRSARGSDAGILSSSALMASGQAAQRSRNGSVSTMNGDGGDWPMDQAMGVLEFTPPELPSEETSTHLVVASGTSTSAVLKHLSIGDDTRADLITRQADLSLATTGTHEVGGSERKGKVSWRFVFAVEDDETGADARVLRPLRFSCSTTLLDPARARKSRVLNMIKKQMGNHLESHSVDTTHSSNEAGGEGDVDDAFNVSPDGFALPPSHLPSPPPAVRDPPLSPRSLPRSRDGMRIAAEEQRRPSSASHRVQGTVHAPVSPTHLRSGGSRAGSGQDNLLSLRNGSMASVMTNSSTASATWSPMSRPGLVPFKVTRPFVEALRESGRISDASEHGASVHPQREGVVASGLPGGATAAPQQQQQQQQQQHSVALSSPRTNNGSLPSPLTSVESSPSPRKSLHELRGSISSAGQHQRHANGVRLQQQQHHARHITGPAPSTALGLETNCPSDERFAPSVTSTVKAKVVASFQAEEWDDGSAMQWASSQSRTRARRLRTATEGVAHPMVEQARRPSSSRPPTASEEIKANYLKGLNAMRVPQPSLAKQSRGGGSGNGHGHSHSVVHAAYDNGPLPPRRLTSASINGASSHAPRPLQQQTQPTVYAQGQAPSSPLYPKRQLAAPNSRCMPHFDAPEGSYWL